MADQLAGVLREIVAIEDGRTSHSVSARFTGELRTATDAADWRALPIPLVDGTDPAAGFLAAVSATDTDELLALLDLAPGPSLEVELRKVRELLDAGRVSDARDLLDGVAPEARNEWRVAWHEALWALATDDPEPAVDAFASVYRALPGELAPKLALGAACECAGDTAGAERWYDVVSRTDAAFTSAVFGLARCLVARGDRDAAVVVFDRVPNNFGAYVDAQIAKTETMIEAGDGGLTVDRVLGAAKVLDGLGTKLTSEPRARLTALVLRSALAVMPPEPNGTPPRVLGNALTDEGIRLGLERTYRELARQARDPAARIELVDEANRLRPRTLT
jgi:serine/threonine-protein kinase PknG